MTRPASPSIRRIRGRRGFTLIEVLVTIVILSIGLLGIAGLQAATSKYRINSWARSATSMLYSDLSDRMRANPEAESTEFIKVSQLPGPWTAPSPYELKKTWSQQQSEKADSGSANDCGDGVTTCTPADQAAYDMERWRRRVSQSLPQGAALVTGNRVSGFNVTLMWFDKDFVEPGTTTALETAECTAEMTGLAAQSCCPQDAGVPAGVRCLNMSLVP